MMTNVYKYDEINRLAFFNVKSDFNSLLKQLIWQLHKYFSAKSFIFHQMFRSKSQKVKTSIKLNVLVTIFVHFFS